MIEASGVGCEVELGQIPGEGIFLAEPTTKLGAAVRHQGRCDIEDAGTWHATQPLQRRRYDEISAIPDREGHDTNPLGDIHADDAAPAMAVLDQRGCVAAVRGD